MASHLALLRDETTTSPARPVRAATPSANRPGDLCEAITFERIDRLPAIAREAEEHGLTLEAAIALLVERQVTEETLLPVLRPRPIGVLDRVAREQAGRAGERGVFDSHLRLLRESPCEESIQVTGTAITVPVPLRILDRVLAGRPSRGLRPNLVRQAKAWEIAGLVNSQTMLEWALLVALRDTRGRGSSLL